MIKLDRKELNNISGGISGAVVTSLIRSITLILDIGKMFGSAIRRFATRRYC